MSAQSRRCAIIRSESVSPGPDYCHAHELHHPCGKVSISHAAQPPISVAAKWRQCRTCPVETEARRPKQRPAFMWEMS